MKLATLLITLVALCYACGVDDAPPPGADIELYPYYERFMIDLAIRRLPAASHIRSLRWADDFSGDTIGVCQTWEGLLGPKIYSYRVVKIRRDMMNDPKLSALVYHELGHCIMNFKNHSRSPYDIMYYQILLPLTDGAKNDMFDKYARGEDYTEE